ncbi:SDR family oxidoreductase [Natrialba sp. SSL1]|uniref:SDR family oxidoreductase n=1 Tax=Natrialba sp. SSL1 TaxID=1869245 RepID=UPI00209ACED4|nr:SDR family oxidoreductase [Natrialba sp. SSL1]
MKPELRPISEQVIVITGASSGIGLTTARMAADRGARLVLAARSEDALQELHQELTEQGHDVEYVVADVREPEDIRTISQTAQDAYGGYDTWINGAAVSIYGKLRDVPLEDLKSQFDTNVWGLLYGSFEAAEHLRDREGGGAIINIGSIASERAFLMQGSYSASKHAVKGFTDALRMELEEEGAPISVTLIKPGAIDTPYPEHAKNYMDQEATVPAPVYAPETVARAILHAAEEPQREVTVGGGGKALTVASQYAPRILDRVMESLFIDQQQRDRPASEGTEAESDSGLEEASAGDELAERGEYEGHVAETSLYTKLTQRRSVPTSALAGLGAVAGYALYRAIRGVTSAETNPESPGEVAEADDGITSRLRSRTRVRE